VELGFCLSNQIRRLPRERRFSVTFLAITCLGET
jgi:hypothetical protein